MKGGIHHKRNMRPVQWWQGAKWKGWFVGKAGTRKMQQKSIKISAPKYLLKSEQETFCSTLYYHIPFFVWVGRWAKGKGCSFMHIRYISLLIVHLLPIKLNHHLQIKNIQLKFFFVKNISQTKECSNRISVKPLNFQLINCYCLIKIIQK